MPSVGPGEAALTQTLSGPIRCNSFIMFLGGQAPSPSPAPRLEPVGQATGQNVDFRAQGSLGATEPEEGPQLGHGGRRVTSLNLLELTPGDRMGGTLLWTPRCIYWWMVVPRLRGTHALIHLIITAGL